MAPQPDYTKSETFRDHDLCDEDLELKRRLELCVELVQYLNPLVQKSAFGLLQQEIRAASNSMKPIMFLRPHFGALQDFYHNMPPHDELKKQLADILSVLAPSLENLNTALEYRLLGSGGDVGYWGHEYVRRLTCDIFQEYSKQKTQDAPTYDRMIELVLQIVAWDMEHNAEIEAVDLLMEIEDLPSLVKYVVEENYEKTCIYLTSLATYLNSNSALIQAIVQSIYMRFEDYPRALQTALHFGNMQCVKQILMSCNDPQQRQQLCFNIARHGITLEVDVDIVADDDEMEKLQEIIDNSNLIEGYRTLARDLDVMDPKLPEDIHKGHGSGSGTVESARQNLADTYVNGFLNAGFGQDKLMTVPSDASSGSSSSTSWLFKNKEHGKISAAASLGMIFLWDVEPGLAHLDKYFHSTDNDVLAGALLGAGIVNCNVHNECDPALALLTDYVDREDSSVRIGAIMGLGLAYAGSQNEKVYSKLMPILGDRKASLDVIAFAAISLGLVYVGSCNEEVAQAIIFALTDRSESELGDPLARFMPLGLGLLYLGKQESVEATAEVSKTFNEKIRKYSEMTLLSCAYAGTGDVLKVQHFLSQCAPTLENGESYQGAAVLGIAMVAMGEGLGLDMSIRALEHLLQYGELNIRRAVPLALGLLCISNPKVNVIDTLSRLSHDADTEIALVAIVSLGLIGAGTNNARIARILLDLSSKDASLLFCVRIAQGLLHMGKGLMTLSLYHSERVLLSPTALAGIVTVLHTCLDMKTTILGKYHYVLYFLALAMQPRMLKTLDEDLKPLSVPVRVGQAVDVVGRAGHPKTITGFQTHNTPVLLSAGERAELATNKYIPLSPILEGFVILRVNPDFHEDL